MEILATSPDLNFDICRSISEQSEGEVGIRAVLFGIRVCGNRIGSGCYAFDYCAGRDYGFAVALLAVMHTILKALPEATTTRELEVMLPKDGIRPNTMSSECATELFELAKKLTQLSS